MRDSKPVIRVLFRYPRAALVREELGGPLALLIDLPPGLPYPPERWCLSYARAGGFGPATILGTLEASRNATPEEYAETRSELAALGYRAKVVKHVPRNAYACRLLPSMSVPQTSGA
jgi:hypothetical protein